MAELLRIHIFDFKGRMVHVVFRPLVKEERVVVDEFVAAVKMQKRGHITTSLVMDQLF